VARFVERREKPRIDIDAHRLLSTGGKLDLGKTDQPLGRFPACIRGRGIDLTYRHSRAAAAVAEGELNSNCPVRRRSGADRTVVEDGVGKPVPEGEQGLRIRTVDPFVADRGSF